MSALTCFAEETRLQPDDVYLFCCFFVNNQYRIDQNFGTDALRSIFEQRLASTENLLVLMDRFDDSQWSKRLWCVFEAYTATARGIDFKVLLPSAGRTHFISLVNQGRLAQVRQQLQNLDIRHAKASQAEDHRSIHKLINETIGYDAVNATVADKLCNCLVKEIETFFRDPQPGSPCAGLSQSDASNRVCASM